MIRPLNKREQKKLLRKEIEKKDRTKKTIARTLFFAGVFFIFFLALYSIVQYHWTIIDYKIPLAILIISGITFGAFFKLFVEKMLSPAVSNVQVFWSYFSAGVIGTALFFFINKILTNPEIYTIEAPILETYYTGRRSKGIGVEIQLGNDTKDLHFPLEDEARIDSANVILLHVSKGALGFEIIRDRIPVE